MALRFPVNLNTQISYVQNKFVNLMEEVSDKCNSRMIDFCRAITGKSVQFLHADPPCNFSVLAMGSLARGESTPFSDFEYLFLLGEKTNNDYFHKLAITSYFIIGNLCETKLSYMSIDELNGWFDDCTKNGFKIDGLQISAGNIPTGNGREKSDTFIVTFDDLKAQYAHVLNNPGKESVRGDLTAMLTYLKEVYVYGKSPFNSFLRTLAAFPISENRRVANLAMLKNDVSKFSFNYQESKSRSGYTVNAKKQLFRFISILLLDLAIVYRCPGMTCWETISNMCQQRYISQSLSSTMKFILACACFIRSAAYLAYDSHYDTISVAQKTAESLQFQPESQGQRWSVPPGVYVRMCQHLLPMQICVQNSLNNLEALSSQDITDSISSLSNKLNAYLSSDRYADA